MRISIVLCALSFAFFVPAGQAEEFSTGFQTGYNHGTDVSGQNDWTINDPTPDLSFFVRMNGSDAAAMGGFYDAPGGPGAILAHPVEVPLAESRFRVSLAVLPSTSLYPGRDVFGWTITDPAGVVLYTLRFVPATSNPDRLNITWSTGTGNAVNTGWAITYAALYSIDLKFTSAGNNNLAFAAIISGANNFSFSGLLPGLGAKTWGGVGTDFMVEGASYGDNYMAFDDLSVAPLPIVDVDGDGYSAETEAWFGTSDTSRLSSPAPSLSIVSGASVLLTFPSVPGNGYLVQSSEDLATWFSAPVTAAASSTSWSEPVASGRRFFRVRKP